MSLNRSWTKQIHALEIFVLSFGNSLQIQSDSNWAQLLSLSGLWLPDSSVFLHA